MHNKIQHVKEQLSQNYPVFSPSFIADVADISGVSYHKVLAFIQSCKICDKDVHQSLHEFIRSHRPDLVAFQKNDTEQSDTRMCQGA